MSSVDVIIPSYNYASFLPDCVKSILNQDGVEIRILIIDDTSSDTTPEVCSRLAKHDSRVQYRRHTRNKGHISTYNEGLEWAEADYTLLLSADDWLVSGALARAAHVLDGNPEIVVACGKALVAQSGQPLPEPPDQKHTCNFTTVPGQRFIEKCCANAAASPLWTPTAVVRTSVQKKVGGYNKELPHAGDLEMWLRFACYGSIAYLDAYQAYYRKHGENMHYKYAQSILQNTLQHLHAFNSVFKNNADKIAEIKRLSRIYHRSFALDALASANKSLALGKKADAEKYREFAVKLFPKILFTKQWFKHCLRRILGTELTEFLRAVVNLPSHWKKNTAGDL